MTETVREYRPPARRDDPRVCRKCAASWNIPGEHDFVIQNSRTDKYHSGGEYGQTDCGIDATHDHYRWPL